MLSINMVNIYIYIYMYTHGAAYVPTGSGTLLCHLSATAAAVGRELGWVHIEILDKAITWCTKVATEAHEIKTQVSYRKVRLILTTASYRHYC